MARAMFAGGEGATAGRRQLGFGLLLAIFLVLLVFPLIPGINNYQKSVVLGGFFWAIMAASWALLAGVAGQFSFAHMGFVGIAAYSAGLLWEYGFRESVQGLGEIHWLPSAFISVGLILFGGLVTGIVGFIVGWLLLRLRSSYLALFTIAFSEIVRKIIVAEEKITGGMNGLPLRPLIQLGESPEVKSVERDLGYFVMFGLLVVSLLLMYAIANSRVGLFLRAMREDEDAASSLGVNVVRYKIFIFTFTAVIVGIVGSVFNADVGAQRITPEALRLLSVSLMITYAVIGGMESMLAAAAGAFISRVLLEVFREIPLPFGIRFDHDVFSIVFLALAVGAVLWLMRYSQRPLRPFLASRGIHWQPRARELAGLGIALAVALLLVLLIPLLPNLAEFLISLVGEPFAEATWQQIADASSEIRAFFLPLALITVASFALWQLALVFHARLAHMGRGAYFAVATLAVLLLIIALIIVLDALMANSGDLRVPLVGVTLSHGASTFEPSFWRYAVFGILMMLTLRFMRNGILYPVLQWFQGRDMAMQETVAIRKEREDDDFGDEDAGGGEGSGG